MMGRLYWIEINSVRCVECVNDKTIKCVTIVNHDAVHFPQPGSIKRILVSCVATVCLIFCREPFNLTRWPQVGSGLKGCFFSHLPWQCSCHCPWLHLHFTWRFKSWSLWPLSSLSSCRTSLLPWYRLHRMDNMNALLPSELVKQIETFQCGLLPSGF